MKIATILVAGAVLGSVIPAQAQTTTDPATGKPARTDVVKVPHGSTAAPSRNGNGTDRMIDDELKRIDRMMVICTGC